MHTMTGAQSAVLAHKRNQLLLKAVLLAGILGICAFWAVLRAQASGESVYYAVALCIVIATVLVGMDVVDFLLAIQQDVKLNRIAQSETSPPNDPPL